MRLWNVGILCGAVLLGVAACAPSDQQAVESYQKQVLSALGRSQAFEGTLGELMAWTIGDLGCTEDLCTSPVRFQYLNESTPQRRAQVADYQGKVCQNKDLTPPASLKAHHDLLCDNLNRLFKALDAIETNARVALTVVQAGTGAENEAIARLQQEIANRIQQQHDRVLEIQAALQGIPWLQPAL